MAKKIAAYLRPRQVTFAARSTALVLALALGATGCSLLTTAAASAPVGPATAAPQPDVGAGEATTPAAKAAVAAAALQRWWNGRSYNKTRWWQSAIALSAVTSYMQASGSRAYLGNLKGAYRAFHNTSAFTHNYYDDMGWWALAWAQSYALTRNPGHLAEAKHIFGVMTAGWDANACSGGLPWSKTNDYKNAITNELFLDVAATLHNLIPGDKVYARWALREWNWFRASGLINAQHLVVDGLSGCQPILDSPTWTYNQGVLIGGLIQLSRFSSTSAPLTVARQVARAVMSSATLSPNGVMREPCEPDSCGRDAPAFKGVLAQNLGLLAAQWPSPRLRTYLRRNAQSAWDSDRRGDEFGLQWEGPFDVTGSSRQTSALAILTTQVSAAGA